MIISNKVRKSAKFNLNVIYRLQSLFISIKICIVDMDIIMMLHVPAKSVM